MGFVVLLSLGNRVVRFDGHPLPHQLWVYGGLTRAQLADAEIVCSGHFAPATSGADTVSLTIDSYTYTGVARTTRPFAVDHYWKGNGPATLDVVRFESLPLVSDYLGTYDPANSKRFLLALKKDTTGSPAWQLTDIMNAWVGLPDSALANAGGLSPERAIESGCVNALESYATYKPPAEPPGQYGLEQNNYEMLYQALATLKNFGTNDPRTVAALKAIYTNPNLSMAIMVAHREAFEDLAQIDPAQAAQFGMDQFNAGTLSARDRDEFVFSLFHRDPMGGYRLAVQLDAAGKLSPADRHSFAHNLGRAITKDTYAQMDPGFIERMIAGDNEAEHHVCDAFSEMRDPRGVPWLGKFLDSLDPSIQFRAMDGLYYPFMQREGADKGVPRPDSRQIFQHVDHEHRHGLPYPDAVTAPYKAWVRNWMTQHPEYALP